MGADAVDVDDVSGDETAAKVVCGLLTVDGGVGTVNYALGYLDMGGPWTSLADLCAFDAWECSYYDSLTAIGTG